MHNILQMNRTIEELEQKELTEVEREMLRILKYLNMQRVHDTSSVLSDLKTDVSFFWLRFNQIDEKIQKINHILLKTKNKK